MKYWLFILLPVCVWAQSDPWKNVYTESAWKERDAWQKPTELIEKLRIGAGSVVADVGSHEGYLTFKLATAVGTTGKVYAVDVEQYKLDRLKQHATERSVKNIVAVKGDYDNPHLPQDQLDAVVILDTYHEMDDHDVILQHIKQALKKGGRLVLCEPIAAERRQSSREAQEAKHELGLAYAVADLKKAGFRIVSRQDPFVDRTKVKGDVMWLVVAEKD
jgi:ubiquinone/menaquinone biosynthesis C-methylase UbiE